jgi:protein-disulfide isomerase
MNMVVHPQQVQMAHQYGCAAAKQNKFIAFKTAFWKSAFEEYVTKRDSSALGADNILKFAPTLKLDVKKLKADAESQACKDRVDEDMAELNRFKVGGTPAFFINGTLFSGGMPKEDFARIIAAKLSIAQASGVSGADYYKKEIMGKGLRQFRSKKDAKK